LLAQDPLSEVRPNKTASESILRGNACFRLGRVI
jgi:hypothetical protein